MDLKQIAEIYMQWKCGSLIPTSTVDDELQFLKYCESVGIDMEDEVQRKMAVCFIGGYIVHSLTSGECDLRRTT